ncbi:hemerythrin domain-containing protein [Azospirillum sp.]|uniref:hemerythrin domain-containing protein n=1 Tax=Azospirillum sp. TaxID=34012 RepID=UPI003D7253E5
MSDLVRTLKNEHNQLKELLDRVKVLGIGTAEGQRTLRGARQVFVEHLAHEDRDFYPAFLAASARRPDAERMAMQFAAEMTAISKDILGFFDKYKDGGSGLEYARDFGRLSAALFLRWHKEESILYTRYAELAATKAA